LNSCSTRWQYANANAISTIGCGVATDIFCWIGSCVTIPKIGIFCQTPWVTCCVYEKTTSIVITSIGFTCCWKLDWCEGLHSKLHSSYNQFKYWSCSNFKSHAIGFKTRTSSNLQYPITDANRDGIITLGM